MNQDNRFKPPEAAVADVVAPVRRPIIALVVLTLASLFQLDWVWISAPTYIRLVSTGALSPIGLAFAVVGLACLFVGLLRALVTARRGGHALWIAAACLGLALVFWRGLSLEGCSPIIFGITLAVAGWILLRARKREVSRFVEADGGSR